MNLRLVAALLVVANLVAAWWWLLQPPDRQSLPGRAAPLPPDAPRLALIGELDADARKALEKPRGESAPAAAPASVADGPPPTGLLCVAVGPFDDRAVELLASLLYLLPISWSDALANVLGDLARNTNAKRRRIARINLELCFPELSDAEHKQILRKHFRAQVRSVLHLGRLWWGSKKYLHQLIVLRGQEHIEKSLARGKSVIIMAGHSVGLEAASASIVTRYLRAGPMKLIRNPLLNYFIAKGRARHGGNLYTREAGLRPIIKDVRAGHILFYLSDEDLGAERPFLCRCLARPRPPFRFWAGWRKAAMPTYCLQWVAMTTGSINKLCMY